MRPCRTAPRIITNSDANLFQPSTTRWPRRWCRHGGSMVSPWRHHEDCGKATVTSKQICASKGILVGLLFFPEFPKLGNKMHQRVNHVHCRGSHGAPPRVSVAFEKKRLGGRKASLDQYDPRPAHSFVPTCLAHKASPLGVKNRHNDPDGGQEIAIFGDKESR